MNFTKIWKSITKAMDAIGGGWVAILIGVLLLALILYLVFRSGKQLKLRIPFLPAPFNMIKIGRDPKKARDDASAAGAGEKEPEKPIVGSMFEGIDLLSGSVSKRYDIPVYLLVSQYESAFDLVSDAGDDVLQRLSLKDHKGDESGSCVVLRRGCLIHHDAPELIIAELIHSRPERPLDGVVFAIPVEDLLNPNRAERQKKLDWLFQQFWAIQKDIEFSLPVYLMISGLDHLDGFEEFWALPEVRSLHDEVWGWSNPYNVNTPFNPIWVQEAFDHTLDNLMVRFSEVVARERGSDSEAALVFVQSFRQLFAPTKAFAEGIFDSSSLQHPSLFRGVYFSGVVRSGSRSRHGFLKDLFKRKIFPESGLAIPRYERLLSADKYLRNLQIFSFVALATLAMWSGLNMSSIYEQKNELSTAVESVRDLWREKEGYEVIRPLFSIMADMDASAEYCCGPLPLSEVLSINAQVEDFFKEEMFSKRIFPAMECRSRQRLEDLTRDARFTVAGGLRDGGYSRWLDQVVDETRTHEQLRRLMENVLETRSEKSIIEEFSEVSFFLYDEELPAGFSENSDLYIEALADNSFDIELLGPEACPKSVARIDEVWNVSLRAAEVEIEKEISRISAPIDFIKQVVDFESVSIDRVQIDELAYRRFMDWQEYFGSSWNREGDNSYCMRTSRNLNTIATVLIDNDARGEPLKNDIDAFLNACVSAVGIQLGKDNARLPRTLYSSIYQNEMVFPRIATSAKRVFDSITEMSKLSFADVALQDWTERSANFYWSVDELSKALEYSQDYLSFAENRYETMYLPDSPSENRQTYLAQAIVLSQLQRAMLSTIESAKTTVTPSDRIDFKTLDKREAAIADRVANFRKSLDPLLSLVSAFDQLGLTTAKRSLLMESQNHAVSLLKDIDALFNANQVYAPRVNPKWKAHQYTEAFYGLLSATQVEDYLAAQDQRSRILALDYAQPVVIYLANTQGSFAESDLLGRWLRTLVEINKRQNKDPSNDIETFEQFFAGEFFETNLSNCHEQVKAFERPMGGSVFAIMNRTLIDRAFEHCQSFQADTIKKEYQRVAEAFDKYLAPFYPYNRAVSARPLAPKTLKAFLKIYAGETDGLAERVRVLAWKYSEFEKAKAFITDLDNSLALMYEVVQSSTKDAQPGIEMAVQFDPIEVSSSDMDFTSHISRKSFQVGKSAKLYPGIESPMYWNFGDQASFEIEWASGSPYQLLTAEGKSALGRLRYESEGYWGLLKFIETYRSARPDHSTLFEESMLVEFSGGVKRSQSSSKITPLKSFVRITLFGSDPETQSRVPLVVPKIFPSSPPKLRRG
jgi:hypothetical protein